MLHRPPPSASCHHFPRVGPVWQNKKTGWTKVIFQAGETRFHSPNFHTEVRDATGNF